MRRFLITSVLAAALSVSASAASVLWYVDSNQGTNVIPGALALGGHTGTQATSVANLGTQILAGGWDVIIIGEQNTTWADDNGATQSAITNWISGGGALIAATFASPFGGNSILPGLLGATFGDSNDSPLNTSAHPIYTGVGATIAATDPGWNIFTRGFNPTGGSVALGSLGADGGTILGNGGRTLLNNILFDSYQNQAQGELFVANEIAFLTSEVPEPGTYMLMGAGLGVLGLIRQRRAIG